MEAIGKLCRKKHVFMAVFAIALPFFAFKASAAENAVTQFKSSISYNQYHVHYDVNADGTYKESDELAMTVLNEQAVQMSKQMPIGMPNMFMAAENRDVEILAAYTLKKNGEHIDAKPVNQPGMGVPASGVTPILAFSQMPIKYFAFQKVKIGDSLVVSYKVIQKKPIFPNNIVINQIFPKFVVYDDAIISLNAPVSLSLRVDTSGVKDGERKIDGSTQKWVWTYQNTTAELPLPDHPPVFNRIHISSFKDNATEMQAMSSLAAAFQKSQPSQRCQVFPGQINDGPAAVESYSQQVAISFWHADEQLNRMVDDWNISTCMFDDGRLRLTALGQGFRSAFNNEKDWSKSLARVEELKKKFPNKPFVALAEVEYWEAYAWNARGGGYASSVTQEGWKLFHERLMRAEKVLIDTKPYSANLPVWYSAMVNIQSLLNRPEDQRDKVLMEGIKRYPTYYPIYFGMLEHLTPKWGGSWDTVDNMIVWSVEQTKATEGNSMYARLYWVASGGLPEGESLFKDTHASWPKMKRGFEDLMTHHPKSKWNLNNFAMFSCMAGDKKTFLTLRKRIGKDVIDAAWPTNTSLDLCETKYGYAQ